MMPELSEHAPIPEMADRYRPATPGTSADSVNPSSPVPLEWGAQIRWGAQIAGYSKDGVPIYAVISIPEEKIPEMLHVDAAETLKEGSRYELRQLIPDNFGRGKGMAWYRSEKMDEAESWGEVPDVPRLIESHGYYLVGQFIVGNQ